MVYKFLPISVILPVTYRTLKRYHCSFIKKKSNKLFADYDPGLQNCKREAYYFGGVGN